MEYEVMFHYGLKFILYHPIYKYPNKFSSQEDKHISGEIKFHSGLAFLMNHTTKFRVLSYELN